MRIVVTGAGGFVGSRLIERLSDHDIVAIEHMPGRIPKLDHVTSIVGDLCDAEVRDAAFSARCDAVVHLATVPGGAAEQDPALAWKVNIEATMALVDAAVSSGQCPRFVFASSIAVFGDPLPSVDDDSMPLTPRLLYGAHKAMTEQWLATLTRRGAMESLSLRLSGVVARPLGPSGMKSAFLSEVFHAIRAGEPYAMPVSPGATSWLTSRERAVDNFIHALELEYSTVGEPFAMTLPALRVTIADLVAEIAGQSGTAPDVVSYEPDEAIESVFGSYPPLETALADSLGFRNDGDVAGLVTNVLTSL